jgi:hypothetical protein
MLLQIKWLYNYFMNILMIFYVYDVWLLLIMIKTNWNIKIK